LNELDIEANVVLINTVSKKEISEWLPSPLNFNHATVRVKIDGEYYYFDPTISYQRGNLKDFFYPDYQIGLVVDKGTSALSKINFKSKSEQNIKEYIKVADIEGGATLVVNTIYKGAEADDIRAQFSRNSINELMQQYQKFYHTYFEGIKIDSITFSDIDSTGIFSTEEQYKIPNFFTTDDQGIKKFSFSSFIIKDFVNGTSEKDRKMPFHLAFPMKCHEEIIIEMPRDWTVEEGSLHLKNQCFSYDRIFSVEYNKVKLTTDYENLKDHVSVNEFNSFFKDMKAFEEEGFELSFDEFNVGSKKSVSNTPAYILLFLFIIVGGYLLLYRKI
jgi:hypothetical protein